MEMFAWEQSLGYRHTLIITWTAISRGRPPWVGFYPVKGKLVAGADTSRDGPFFVDIGGSMVHDLMEFHKHHPDASGKLILQDLPAIISQIQQLDSVITPMNS